MADYTLTQIADALAVVIQTALTSISDTSVVLTDRRTVEQDSEVLTLVQALQADGEPRAWLISLMQISEADTENHCEIIQSLTYTIETLMPYRRKQADNSTSESSFREMIEAVFAGIRASRNLGLDNRVYHSLIQTLDDFVIMSWEGTGQDSLLTHYAKLRLTVANSVFV